MGTWNGSYMEVTISLLTLIGAQTLTCCRSEDSPWVDGHGYREASEYAWGVMVGANPVGPGTVVNDENSSNGGKFRSISHESSRTTSPNGSVNGAEFEIAVPYRLWIKEIVSPQ